MPLAAASNAVINEWRHLAYWNSTTAKASLFFTARILVGSVGP